MRVLVCGGRYFDDAKWLEHELNFIHEAVNITELIHGGARGADTLAGEWASHREIPVKVFPANWKKHGKAAGFIRNHQMIDEGNPFMVVAFPGGNGTQHMIETAIEKATPVKVLEKAHE